jgi:DNA-binding MarR family transcriptional regulator
MHGNTVAIDAAWPIFLRVHAEAVAGIEQRLAASRLPPLVWYDALWALERAPGQALRMAALADEMVLSRSHLSHLVARLESQDLVLRQRTAEDGRGTVAVLTDKGATLRRSMWSVYREAIAAEFARHLPAADARALAGILRRLLAARRRHG